MIAATVSHLGKRLGLIGAIAATIIVLGGAAADAQDAMPDAVIVDPSGEVVVEIEDRADAPVAFEEAVTTRPGRQLSLQYIYRTQGSVPFPPNDPYFAQQWNLGKVGVPSAWGQTDGEGVIVAVLDTTINFTGPDGFCGQVVDPYDAIAQAPELPPLNATARFGHGTFVAGTIAQCTDNGTGVAGIAPGVSLMPVRVLSNRGGTTDQLARGIDWAVDHGADVINMSLGGPCKAEWPACGDTVVDAAIARAHSAGVVMVAASGNYGLSYVAYPANNPNVLAVGAVGSDDVLWDLGVGQGSDTGADLSLVAPGVDILQEATKWGVYGYYLSTGTSMAAPHVSAAAADVLAVNPNLSMDQVVAILESTAVDLGTPGFDTQTGWGRLDVGAAVNAALAMIAPESSTGPCSKAPCDSIGWVDAGGLWGLWDALTETPSVSSFYFGEPGDVPFMGDWDGDGVATPGLYRRSDGFVYIRYSNTQGVADLEFFFGNPGAVPLAGDFDGDGRDSVSIWRPSEARVYVTNELGADGGELDAAEFSFSFGDPGDTPFVGDFDGDGVDTVSLYRPSTGFVYFRNSLSTGNADLSFFYGNLGDQIFVGDWDGDGDDTVAAYRPSTGRVYANLENTNGAADWDGFVGSYPYLLSARNR